MANLEIEIGAVTSGLDKALNDAESKLSSFSKKATNVGKTLSVAVTLPLLAIGGVAVKAASDVEEAGSKFNTVFRDIEDDSKQALQTLRKEYGLSGKAALELLGDTGDLLTGFGFSQKAALDLSTEVNKLAVDLASFTNYSGGAAGASDALTKALLGERESVKALGIAILEEDVNKQVAINTAKGLTFETERQAKAYATLDLAIQQSGNAIGDYARTQDSFANQSRLLQNNIADLTAEFGQILLPVAERILEVVNKLITGFQSLSTTAKTIITVIAGVAAAAGPLLLAIGSIGAALPAIKAGALAVSAAFTPLVVKIIAVTAAVTGLAIVVKGLVDSWDTVSEFFSQLWDEIKITFINGITTVLKSFNKLTSAIGLDFSDTIDNLEAESKRLSGVLDSKPVVTLGDTFRAVGKSIKETFVGVKNDITSSMQSAKASIDRTNESLAVLSGGGSGINRNQSTAIGGVGNRELGSFASLDTSGAGIQIPQINEESKNTFLESLDQFNQEASNILTNGVSNVIGDFAFSIGEALGAGANVVDTIGATLLKGIATIANQLGQAAIGIGVSMLAIKKSFSNPFTAIAAGAALVALAGVISSQVPKIVSGGGGTSGVSGGQSFAGSGTNNALVDSISGLEVSGTSTIKGQDIVIAFEKTNRTNQR